MELTHVPLLQIQRDLHDIPRGMERFQAYLKAMVTDDREDMRYPPLAMMNPMGREHVAARLDEWIALGAETIAADGVAEAVARLPHATGTYRHGLGIGDDIMGGWTNRYTSDAMMRFPDPRFEGRTVTRFWLSTLLWVSEPPDTERLRQAVLTTVARFAYMQQQGAPRTLGAMMAQEGWAAAFAGRAPTFDAEELAYTREVLQPHRTSDDYALCFVGMYGDTAARAVGYPPLGLSDGAGFELGLAEALAARAAVDVGRVDGC